MNGSEGLEMALQGFAPSVQVGRIEQQVKVVASPRNHLKARQVKSLAGFLYSKWTTVLVFCGVKNSSTKSMLYRPVSPRPVDGT